VIGKYPNSSAMIAIGGAAAAFVGLLSRIGSEQVADGMINDLRRMSRRDDNCDGDTFIRECICICICVCRVSVLSSQSLVFAFVITVLVGELTLTLPLLPLPMPPSAKASVLLNAHCNSTELKRKNAL